MNNKIAILTDSTCDLTEEIQNKYGIDLVPLHVTFENESFLDGKEIKLNELFDKIESTGKIPKTSAVSPFEMRRFFKKYLEQGYDIVYCGISSALSSTYQVANLAKEDLEADNIYVVDSGNLSTGIGLLLLKAATYRDQGFSAKQIAKKLEDLVPRVKVQFVIDTLENLHKGGRCSGIAYVFSKVLKVKPMIVVREKTMQVGAKFIGSISKAQKGMTNIFLNDFDKIDKEFVFITHSLCPSGVEYIKEMIKDKIPQIENLYETTAGCVIGTHCGKNTVGILYILKDGTVKKEENIA